MVTLVAVVESVESSFERLDCAIARYGNILSYLLEIPLPQGEPTDRARRRLVR